MGTSLNNFPELLRWITRLHAAAREGDALRPPRSLLGPSLDSFRDEFNQRRAVDAPFLRWRIHQTEATPSSPPISRNSSPDRWDCSPEQSQGINFATAPPELAAWHALLVPATPAQSILNLFFASPTPDAGIEVQTESELCLLHALWQHATRRGAPPGLRERCRERCDRLIDTLQPDNATNRPWAIHVFALAGAGFLGPPRSEADHYAQTLLHNCRVSLARPDTMSAQILADAAESLEHTYRTQHERENPPETVPT